MTVKRALIVVDIQNDFLPGGALAVPDGDRILPAVHRLMDAGCWTTVVVTQDWHPAQHSSFASNHPGAHNFDIAQMSYGPQVLWPDHCVQGTKGAAFADGFRTDRAALILRKGMEPETDSYSAFCAADGKTDTGLAAYLKARGVTHITVCGLATDFCVNYTALDAAKAGFTVEVVTNASAAIDLNHSLAAARRQWTGAGIKEVSVVDVLAHAREDR